MEIGEIIDGLKNSGLIAESPCGCEFELSAAILFDGTKPFPKEALETKKSYLEQLKGGGEELKKQKKLILTNFVKENVENKKKTEKEQESFPNYNEKGAVEEVIILENVDEEVEESEKVIEIRR